ncbi:hypothetical protein EXIGLDRAFT_743966 [Exidia glandulosa HHB12029]|uniref:Protein HRI1 n=1 Tax=Exidia glandulosa HHB12029 TaxID=1314781 RepID=A0A165QG36_EXIGL|nr:hypothetical protein EXIGLDRAFT_743966 [Exidia glandulosa HHB12029]
MTGEGDISVREWICWDGESPEEPTSTLVLTTPSATFLDIRLLLRVPIGLDWGFSGSSESLPPTPSEPEVPRKMWNHVIDSRCAWGVTPQSDEGTMYPVPGRPEACLEKGAMEKVPGSGVSVGYEEMWVSVDPRPVGNERDRHGMVLSLSSPEEKTRGIVIRVAQFCQGMIMIDDEISLERWEYHVADGGWQRVAKLGERFLPCQWTFEGGKAENVEAGKSVKDDDGKVEWKVDEKFSW